MTKLKESELGLLLLKISHFLFLTYSLLGHIDIFHDGLKLFTYISIVLLACNFLLQYNKASIKECCFYLMLLVLSLFLSQFSSDYGFFKLMLFAGSVRKVNFKKIVRFDMYLRIGLICLVVFLCLLDIAPDNVQTYEGVIRRSLGFTNPNTLGIAVFILVCDILYVNELRLSVRSFSAIFVISTLLYFYARCRTAVLGILFVLALSFVYTRKKEIFDRKEIKLVMYTAPLIFSGVTFLLVKWYMNGHKIARDIDILLSGRLFAIANFSELLDITWFGQPIHEAWDKTLDNVYAFVAYDLGIVVFVLFVLAFWWVIKKNHFINNKLCIIMCGFMFYGLSEHLWINVDYNIFMLAFFANPMLECSKNSNSQIANKNNIATDLIIDLPLNN